MTILAFVHPPEKSFGSKLEIIAVTCDSGSLKNEGNLVSCGVQIPGALPLSSPGESLSF
jgi:hypothetical protein